MESHEQATQRIKDICVKYGIESPILKTIKQGTIMDKRKVGIINAVTMDLSDMIHEHKIKDKDEFLNSISNIICQLDTDIAIEVMESFGKEGENIALGIKINYGY